MPLPVKKYGVYPRKSFIRTLWRLKKGIRTVSNTNFLSRIYYLYVKEGGGEKREIQTCLIFFGLYLSKNFFKFRSHQSHDLRTEHVRSLKIDKLIRQKYIHYYYVENTLVL